MPFRHLLLTSLMCLATSWAAAIRAGEQPDAAPTADSQQIDRLIRQLGSDDFEAREAASQALARVGGPALDALRKAASTNPDPEARRRAAEIVARIENSLDQLLADYRAFGLPLPPEEAPLVRFEERPSDTYTTIDGESLSESDTTPAAFALGFLVEPAVKDRPAMLLHATETREREAKKVGAAIDPQQLTADYLKDNLPVPRESLTLALQMHARGWDSAKIVFEKGFREKGEHNPRTELRLLAWDYWERRLPDGTDDCWSAAARQMRSLIDDEPGLDTPENRGLLKSLQAALVPSKAAPDSVEALLDDLVHARAARVSNDALGPGDECFARVFDLGFEAVPALLDHLDDDRLTRCPEPPFSYSSGGNYHQHEPPYPYRVGDIASDLLRAIAGRAAIRDWPDRRNNRVVERRCAQAWWDVARKQGEEAYLVGCVLPSTPEDEPPEREWPDVGHVRLLGKKYPLRLAKVYRDVLEKRPHMQSGALAEALAASSLSHDHKVELLALAGHNSSLEHRCAAFWELKELDAERFISLLTATLDDLPRTPAAPYVDCCEAKFASLVSTTDDPGTWRALERAARRADPGLRIEMIGNAVWPPPTEAQRRWRLAFLGAFLDDDTVRDMSVNPKMYVRIYGGAWFRRIEVRNVAALRISEMVGTPADPTAEWTREDWAKLREQAHENLRRELADGARE